MSQQYKQQFIEFCLKYEVIRFGEFTLKSGRISPYFFNAGLFNTGATIAQLGKFYAAAIQASGIEFDTLFGPAYKGIPLVTTTTIALEQEYNINKPFCFNRAVAKDHGEGGNIVGAPLHGRVLVVDDVITAGTAINLAVELIHANNAKLGGVCVALNRQEKGQSDISAIQEIEQEYGVSVISVINLDDLITYVKTNPKFELYLDNIQVYRDRYGV